jgi:ABC-type glycerol-3-phosphate transport system substrate-binding protein
MKTKPAHGNAKKKKNFATFRDLRITATLLFIVLLSLSACANLPQTPTVPTATQAVPTSRPAETQTAADAANEEQTPRTLRVWLPPELDPASDTAAGEILRSRLENFQKRRPDILVEVRIKSAEGEAGLLNALLVTRAAAPSLQPDLIALPRNDFEKAAEAGAIHPLDGLTTLLDDPDWFPYARPLAQIKNSTYGIPFSANLLGLRYTPTENAPVPTLESLQKQKKQILLPKNSTLLSFCFYGNALYSKDGTPKLEENTLLGLLNFYQSDLLTTEQSENALPILWSDRFLDETPADAHLFPIPGPEESTCSLATAWLWSLAGTNPDLQPAAVELAEYLTDSTFLAEWTTALGSLPPRPTALNDPDLQALSLLAQPVPSDTVLESIGRIFSTAVNAVLEEQISPEAAVQEALAEAQ